MGGLNLFHTDYISKSSYQRRARFWVALQLSQHLSAAYFFYVSALAFSRDRMVGVGRLCHLSASALLYRGLRFSKWVAGRHGPPRWISTQPGEGVGCRRGIVLLDLRAILNVRLGRLFIWLGSRFLGVIFTRGLRFSKCATFTGADRADFSSAFERGRTEFSGISVSSYSRRLCIALYTLAWNGVQGRLLKLRSRTARSGSDRGVHLLCGLNGEIVD